MAKKKETAPSNSLWGSVDPLSFESEDNIEDQDLGTYNTEKMALFALNINCARQLPALEDSLKPVERRILYVMYQMNAYDGKKAKSSGIIGRCLVYHPHGDSSVYNTLCGMAQGFKRPQKLIKGIGNFGTVMDPSKCAHYRYTEATLSDYATECFFDDYDPDCIEVKTAANMTDTEPVFIPGKFPNILVNGATSIAYGYNTTIPPYPIDDIIRVTKTLIKNPKAKNIVMIPDIPTGCDIVDTGEFAEICKTGSGRLRMRSNIDIVDNGSTWILKVTSIPWQSSLVKIQSNITALARAGEIPIKDIHDRSYAVYLDKNHTEVTNMIDFEIVVDKAYDPNTIKQKLFKKAGLEKTIAVNFQVVQNGLQVRSYGVAELLLQWINSRREYLRRLYNKRYAKYNARMGILRILIELTEAKNLEKTVRIIRASSSEEIEKRLVSDYGMNSFQAKKIADMSLRAFTSDAHDRYCAERDDLQKKMDDLRDIVQSEDRIDDIIIKDLDCLRKYDTGRKCKVIKVDGNNSADISDTNHILIFTKKGFVKKLPETTPGRTKTYGAFSAGDYPVHRLAVNNRINVTMFDSNGKYSVMPVHGFENTSSKDPGDRIFKSTRLDGEIVSAFPTISDGDADYIRDTCKNDVYIMTLSKSGYIKKTPIKEFNSVKILRGVRGVKLKQDDTLVAAFPLMSPVESDPWKSSDVLIYTKLGYYAYLKNDSIPTMGKDTQGVMGIKLGAGDSVAGFCIISPKDKYIIVTTAKGNMKKINREEGLGTTKSRRDSMILTKLATGDTVLSVTSATKKNTKVTVCCRTQYIDLSIDEIPDGTRISKCSKLVPVALGDNIIQVFIH